MNAPIHFDLAHFPDFKDGFSSGQLNGDALEMLMEIRQQLNCLYITHVGHAQPATLPRPNFDMSVLTTLPMRWVVRYSAKSYHKVDPLIRGIKVAQRQPEASGTIRNLSADSSLSVESKQFLRDCELRGLGNLFVTVSTTNPHGYRGVTEFTFEVDMPEQAAFIDSMRRRLSSISTRLHNALHGNRNPALAAAAANLLTKRELDCLHWAANGKTDGEIGEILDIARWTVVTYLQNAKNKLGCANRTATVATALALGVIQVPAIANRF